jgi:hypothetical protein
MVCVAFSGVTGKSGVLRQLSCGKRVINKVVIFNLVIIKPLSEIETLFWMQGDVRSDATGSRDTHSFCEDLLYSWASHSQSFPSVFRTSCKLKMKAVRCWNYTASYAGK